MSEDKKNNNDEPIIEVTATPTQGSPSTQHFSFFESSRTIAGSTVPPLVTTNLDKAIDFTTFFLDQIKENFSSTSQHLVIKIHEEEIDRGWLTHFDLDIGGELNLEGGKWGVKGIPKKEKRKKDTTITIGFEKKEE